MRRNQILKERQIKEMRRIVNQMARRIERKMVPEIVKKFNLKKKNAQRKLREILKREKENLLRRLK